MSPRESDEKGWEDELNRLRREEQSDTYHVVYRRSIPKQVSGWNSPIFFCAVSTDGFILNG